VTIEQAVRDAGLEAPALIVVGDVVLMRESISWFEKRPLFGRRLVVTRARQQASGLANLFEEAGAQALQFPLIDIVPPSSFESLDAVIESIDRYHWLIFTSTNGVESFFERLLASGRDARALHSAKIAAVGNPTAEGLRARGIVPDLVPPRFQSAALLPLLAEEQKGIRTAVIRAAKGSDELLDELRRRGGEVDLAVAYESRANSENAEQLRSMLKDGQLDAITFTSGSTVENFFEAAGEDVDLSALVIASIGPQTSAVIRRFGAKVDVEAESADIEALYRAVEERLSLLSS
jgi:uroporphyrinogen III methyltransferase/synthase